MWCGIVVKNNKCQAPQPKLCVYPVIFFFCAHAFALMEEEQSLAQRNDKKIIRYRCYCVNSGAKLVVSIAPAVSVLVLTINYNNSVKLCLNCAAHCNSSYRNSRVQRSNTSIYKLPHTKSVSINLQKRPGIYKNRQPGTNGIGEYCGQYGLPKSKRR